VFGDVFEIPSHSASDSHCALRSPVLRIVRIAGASARFLEGIRQTLDLAAGGELYLPTEVVPLSIVTENWEASRMPRLVLG
jgi:hypothetical protein